MGHLQLQGISHAFGPRDILRDVTFSISGTDRVALTGANGSGKSTLMRIMAGRISPDSGAVIAGGDTSVAYLPQSGVRHSSRTVLEEVESVYQHARDLEKELESIGVRLERSAKVTGNAASKETDQLVQRHAEITERIRDSGYWDRERAIHRVLIGLGFTESDFDRLTTEFSAGWRMRIALASVLLRRPDVLLLDEPTNYLDLEARDWLEEYLATYPGAVMIVSHDRFFLDRVVDRVAELYLGKIGLYRGNYSEYERKRREEMQAIFAAYEQQQEEIARLEDFIRRFRYNASKAALVQSRIKQLDKIERIEIPEGLKRVHLTFPPAPHSGREVLRLRDVTRRYGEISALEDVDLHLERGDKLVIVGPNGAGKSTLMRIIAGKDESFHGDRRLGTGVSIGYFSQDAVDDPGATETVFESVEAAAPDRGEGEIRNLLGAFLFHGDDAFKPTSVLSGGERSRLELLKLLLSPKNLLVLDEPTNHLDMTSKAVLLDALTSYSGTVVFVSHDRYFIDSLAKSVLELRPPGVDGPRARLFPGDYGYYRRRIEAEGREAESAERESSKTAPAGNERDESSDDGPAKDDHAESKRRRNEIRRLRKREESLLVAIEELEGEKRRLEHELADPAVYSDGGRVKQVRGKLDATEAEIAARHDEWEEISENLEAVEAGDG